MPLSKEDAVNLREDDVVLVAMRVTRTNRHLGPNGVSLSVVGPFFDERSSEERMKFPIQTFKIGTAAVNAVKWRPLRVRDRVQFQHHIYPDAKGIISFIDVETKEAVVRLEDAATGGPQSLVKPLADLERILFASERERFDLDKA